MPISIVVPQLGESVAEGTVAKWLKAEGERVRKEEPLVEIQTDKINVEIPSPGEGILTRILVPEGTTVLVGTEIAQLSGSGEAAAAGAAPAVAAASAAGAATTTVAAPAAPSSSGTGPTRLTCSKRRRRRCAAGSGSRRCPGAAPSAAPTWRSSGERGIPTPRGRWSSS